jgi:hypothetical protein
MFGLQRRSQAPTAVHINNISSSTLISNIIDTNATEIVTWSNRGYYLNDPVFARDNEGTSIEFIKTSTKTKKRKQSASNKKPSTAKSSKTVKTNNSEKIICAESSKMDTCDNFLISKKNRSENIIKKVFRAMNLQLKLIMVGVMKNHRYWVMKYQEEFQATLIVMLTAIQQIIM